ncbi:MAG: PP2C family protein-serine/threonine phosphatase [Actinomycetes bacterium]
MSEPLPPTPGVSARRDHYVEAPASWVAACCDRGRRHSRNEDATAVAASPAPGSLAVLVVCDGVSTSEDSDEASLAGAQAARALLAEIRPEDAAGRDRGTALGAAIVRAAAAANAAVIARTHPQSHNPASCTFAAVVLEGNLLAYGNVGDSRSYWLPDLASGEPAVQLGVDDSVASLRMAAGVPRAEAEEGPQAHAIVKWLGRESPDAVPAAGSRTVSGAGWVLVCSDGLWNYASEAGALQRLLAELDGDAHEPLPLAEALVSWANAQGGRDNIAVALARH